MHTIDQEDMYRLYARPIYCILLSLCHNPQVAEELTAETFYQAIRCIKKYDGTCELKTWLFQIAKNLWRKEARRLSRAAVSDSCLDISESQECQVENLVEDSFQKIELYKRINALDEPYRSVIYLRLSGDLTFDEIGQVLEHTGNWARITYYRAKEKLKQQNEKT